jgi:cytidine deaminase
MKAVKDPPLTSRDKRALLAAARAVRARAHAPYSHFLVGAAVLDERGRVHVGCNVENASYGLTVCAERNAVAAAVAAGARRLRAVSVVTEVMPPASPCGACRQVLAELMPDSGVVLMASAPGKNGRAPSKVPEAAPDETTLGALLPRAFRL